MSIQFKYINKGIPTVDYIFKINWSKKPTEEQFKEFSKLINDWGLEGIYGKYEGWLSFGGHFDYIGDVSMIEEKTSRFHLDSGTTAGFNKGLKALEKKLDIFNDKVKGAKEAIIESVVIEG